MNNTTSPSTSYIDLEQQQQQQQLPPPPTPPSPTPPPSSPPPPEQQRCATGEGTGEERARCEWDFQLSAAISPAAPGEASDSIGTIQFDPTDRLLVTGGIARKIRFYTVGALLNKAEGRGAYLADHGAACDFYICTPAKLSSLRWRPGSGGRLIGSGDYDGVVTEYDVERRAAVFERDEHAGRRVWSVDYSPDGFLGASGSDDGSAHLWDARSGGGSVAEARAGGAICSVEFEPDGRPWIGVGSANRCAYVYDLRAMSAGPLATLGGHERAVTYVRFAGGDGRRVVTSGTDGTHRLWEWEAGGGRQVREFRGHVNARSFVGMSVWRGAGLIGSGSESNEVFVYDLRWGEPVWLQGFDVVRKEENGGPRWPKGGGFVSAVSWKQAAADDCVGVLAAAGSDGVLQLFTGKKEGAV